MLVEGLKNEVQALKNRCDMLKKTVNVLNLRYDTHERSLETFWLEIIKLHRNQGTLDLSYQGEMFGLMP